MMNSLSKLVQWTRRQNVCSTMRLRSSHAAASAPADTMTSDSPRLRGHVAPTPTTCVADLDSWVCCIADCWSLRLSVLSATDRSACFSVIPVHSYVKYETDHFSQHLRYGTLQSDVGQPAHRRRHPTIAQRRLSFCASPRLGFTHVTNDALSMFYLLAYLLNYGFQCLSHSRSPTSAKASRSINGIIVV